MDTQDGDIQTAIDSVEIGETATIKLFPGEYVISDPAGLIIDKPGINIIGSGQNRTFIVGVDQGSRIEVKNHANSVIQSLTSEINLYCEESILFLRDVRMLNNGAVAGVVGAPDPELQVQNQQGSDLTIVNCLIANYQSGIALNNSRCTIRNCTIDSCWGVDYIGGGVLSSCAEGFTGLVDLVIEESIITNNEQGINVAGNVPVIVKNTNIYNPDGVDIEVPGNQLTINDCLSENPRFATHGNQVYYLSSISAGQSENSPCIDSGFAEADVTRMIGGTTRTDGLFDQCRPDIGYHYQRFNEIVDITNLNNDLYEEDDPKMIFNAQASTLIASSISMPDPTSILGMGPKDILIVKEHPDGSSTFQSYFQDDCFLQPQNSPDSPTAIIDASVDDMDGDGSLDLVVLEETGPTFFVNDTVGAMLIHSTNTVLHSRAIETLDINDDGINDILIATDEGVIVQFANDYLDYSDFQILDSGDTSDLVLYDFDGDDDADLVTIDSAGIIKFFKNNGILGYEETGTATRAKNTGKLQIMDMNNDGAMDVVVEIEPGVEQIIEIGGAFGIQSPLPSGKRAIRFALFDHLGTAKMLTNNQGDIVWPRPGVEANELLPFGILRPFSEENAGDLDFNPDLMDPDEASYKLTFTNKEIDHQLDLHYFGARYYHADLPRFISPDPIGGKPTIPISWNRYLYCRNDPVNYFDPDGRTIYIKIHPVIPWKKVEDFIGTRPAHCSILIIPDNQERWAIDERFHQTSGGIHYATIGAQMNKKTGLLIKGLNRQTDSNLTNIRALLKTTHPGLTEDQAIELLLAAFDSYEDNLPYATFPAVVGILLGETGASEAYTGYNSNGFTFGVAEAVGLRIENNRAVIMSCPGCFISVPIDALRDGVY
ncbi:hypothetical protein K8T06_03075 [bacterium]|nr:hypothetical protein [bacterium]